MVHYQQGHLDQGQNTAYMGRQFDMDDGGNIYGFDHGMVKPQRKGDSWFKSKLGLCGRKIKKSRQIGWKPLSLSPLVLATLACLTLLIAAGIEALAQRSTAKGGLALSPTQDEIPSAAKFAYLYIPNIVAAVYSLIWNWVDLDVKRMQPWFELSKPDGTTGEKSLCLNYPCEFVAFVPIKAARLRHWNTFLSGTIIVVVFWLITPLQSAILGVGTVSHSEQVIIKNRSSLLPVNQQINFMDAELLNNAYAVAWLKMPYPQFTTPEYGILPYIAQDSSTTEMSEANITAASVKLSTEIVCEPARWSRRMPTASFYDFISSTGCNTTVPLTTGAKYYMHYIGYYSSPYSDYFLGGSDCGPTYENIHQFLAIWAKEIPTNDPHNSNFNVTALFCSPRYYKQDVVVSVSSQGFRPNNESIQPLSERQSLTIEEFNSTAFEFLIGNGMGEIKVLGAVDIPLQSVIDQESQMKKYSVRQPVTPMLPYALAGQNLSIEAYYDAKTMAEAFNRAHKYLFSLAVNKLAATEPSFSNHTGTATYDLSGIIVSRPISAAVEGLLGLIAILSLILLWLCYRAPCNLQSNPNSIMRLGQICHASPDMLALFRQIDNVDEKTLLKMFKNEKYRLVSQRNGTENSTIVERVSDGLSASVEPKPNVPKGFYDPIRPFALKRRMGITFLFILLGAIGIVAYFKSREVAWHGLPRPSQSFEVLQILENYIPTIFATLLEPFWVLLNRLLCVIQPFRDLRDGGALASRSVGTTYTSIPPQLVLWRAIKARHVTLVIMCVTALVANLLGIGLGALFNEDKTAIEYSQRFSPVIEASFDATSLEVLHNNTFGHINAYRDHLYYVKANISQGSPLPPWVTPQYFFVPHSLPTSSDTYSLQVRGMGLGINCTVLANISVPVSSRSNSSSSTKISSCPEAVNGFISDLQSSVPKDGGNWAMEYTKAFPRTDGDCDNIYMLGWARAHIPNTNVTNGTELPPIRASAALCSPAFRTAMFNVTVDASGAVLTYNRTTDIQYSLNMPNGTQLVGDLIAQTNNLFYGTILRWQNNVIAQDWTTYLIAIRSGSRAFMDPNKDIPDALPLTQAFNDVSSRAFAIFLQLNQNQLFTNINRTDDAISGTRTTIETRIFLDYSAMIITLTVLSINVVVTILFYCKSVTLALPRMPTSIGSIFAYIAPSQAFISASTDGATQTGKTYSFGRYIGIDGEAHVGINEDRLVIPMQPSSIKGGHQFLSFLPLSNARKRNGFRPDSTWL